MRLTHPLHLLRSPYLLCLCPAGSSSRARRGSTRGTPEHGKCRLPNVLTGRKGLKMDAESQEARDARVAWYREAKFGLFIHWGLYAIPAGRWKGEPVAGIGEWIQNRAKIPVAEYAALAAQFNPV